VVDDDLKPNSFCVKINDAALTPARLIDAKQCLVNDTAERIPRSEDGNEGPAPVTNPASGQAGSLVPLRRKEWLEAAGLTTWNQIQFVTLSLAADLRRFGFCLVNRSVVRRHLDRFELAYPALVKAARNQNSDERITRLVRELNREQLSVRDLRTVLEQLLDRGLVKASFGNLRLHDEEDELLAFVRAGLQTQVMSAVAAYSRRLVIAYLVDGEIERGAVERPFSPHSEDAQVILDALGREMALLPATASRPHVLTSREARPVLQRSIEAEFPRVLVVAFDELPPNAVIQPIARLAA
jgi:flagellar biosynthesis protein FlhA